MNSEELSSLFLEPPKSTDEENRVKIETAAGLSDHPFLKELIDTSIKTKVLDSLLLLGERKFEEAYAVLKAVESIQDIQSVLKEAKRSIEEKKISSQEVGGIKY